MMPEKYQYIIPRTPPPAGIFATYQLSHSFYREAYHREQWQQYCKWYDRTAETHRQELKKMRGDVNILGWFNRRRR